MDVDLNSAATEAVLLKARRETLVDALTRLNASAQVEVPVDTGNLRRSHGVDGPDTEAREGAVVATSDYAVYVHEGHREFVFGNPTGRFRPANPWLRRAIDREVV